MNLAILYKNQEQERREFSFRGLRFTEDQRRFYKALKEKIVNEENYVFHPTELKAPRCSGKTTVLLKLAEEFNLTLITHSSIFARALNREFEGIRIIGAREASRIRGLRYCSALVDEGVDIDRIDPGVHIITGINGRNWYYGN